MIILVYMTIYPNLSGKNQTIYGIDSVFYGDNI